MAVADMHVDGVGRVTTIGAGEPTEAVNRRSEGWGQVRGTAKGTGPKPARVLLMCTIPATAYKIYLPLAEGLRNEGHDVAFCCADGAEIQNIRSEGFAVKTIRIRRKPFSPGNMLAVAQLVAFMRKNEVQMIETSTPVASVVGRLAAVIAGVPVRINTIRGMFPRETHRWQSLLFDASEALLHRFSTCTLTINEKDKDELLNKGFAAKDRVMNIGCGGMGVDLGIFDPAAYGSEMLKGLKESLGMARGDFVVTFIGRLTQEKGILDYIDALSGLLRDNDDIRGLVVGDVLEDEYKSISRESIRACLADKGIEDRIVLTGIREDIAGLLAVSDVVALPSKREGFGMVLAEAAAMGKPVVVYRNRGAEEAVIDGVTGYIVDIGDVNAFGAAIRYLYNNRDKARDMGRAARAEAEKRFDQVEIVERYLKVFRDAER